ncbi:rhodanese-like domain-containing protein [Rubrobacter taiwanensis]|uniref:Rhodanese-like domain-containing protein n=2 Tax=Rubrobacter taiwanensis TaxID=185139 RepID=A0A4R1BI92_9ACTN|nr:rhodanese-like domain-containing protein [Rubrobacter taiwanensis]
MPGELEEWRNRGARLVDVREPWEYKRGHLPGAENLDVGTSGEYGFGAHSWFVQRASRRAIYRSAGFRPSSPQL